MTFNTSTLLGATAIIIIIAIMFRDSEGTSRIIRALSDSYVNAVSAFPIQPKQ